jgi:predicted Zn-dependent protease
MPPEITLGQFYQNAGDEKNAEKWLLAGLKAAPKSSRAELAVGQWCMAVNRVDEAEKHAIAATRLDPKSVEAKLFRGTTALLLRDFTAAESLFESLVKQSPQNVIATNNLAMVLAAEKDEAKNNRALELAEANFKKMPNVPEIASTYGLTLYRVGRLEEAAKVMKIAAPLAESDVDTAYVLARLAVDHGNKAEARKLLEGSLRNKKLYIMRQDAEELLEELKK